MDNPYPICENCIFVDEPLNKDPCQECNRAFLAQRIKPNFVSKRKPITNADRIRAMTDEELANYLICDIEAEAVRRTGRMLTSGEIDRAVADCIDWLKQEVET